MCTGTVAQSIAREAAVVELARRLQLRPGMSKRALYETAHAKRGAEFATVFERAMAHAFDDFAVSVTTPEASTGGGARALQHVLLTSRDDRVLVVGSANAAARTAELRTLGYVTQVAERRFGAEAALSRLEYLAFVEKARAVLEQLGFAVTVTAYDAHGGRASTPAPSSSASTPAPASVVALVVACLVMLAATACWIGAHG